MKRAIAPAQREKTMTKMMTSSSLTMVPLVGMVRVQLDGMGVTGKTSKLPLQVTYYMPTLCVILYLPILSSIFIVFVQLLHFILGKVIIIHPSEKTAF
jgi:hypothetical protein